MAAAGSKPAYPIMGESGADVQPQSARTSGGLVKRSFSVAGHRTSVALEQEFWSALGFIAAERGQRLSALVAEADSRRDTGQPLASALRVFALRAFLPQGHGATAWDRRRVALRTGAPDTQHEAKKGRS